MNPRLFLAFNDELTKIAGSREGAAVGGAIPGILALGAPVGAEKGKRARSWGGALGGQIAGGYLGTAVGGGRINPLSFVGAGVGGAAGAYLAHGKNKTQKQKIIEARHKLELAQARGGSEKKKKKKSGGGY